MNQCRHCGAFVPIEKAFCPNCSEPIEPEEAPNRATTSSSDMMSTLRDDPENYREMLSNLKKARAAAKTETAETATAQTTASVVGYSVPQVAPDPVPSAKSNKRTLGFIIGAISFLILLFVILRIFKII
jgi:predicted amidophosphoribosyltransferase